MALSVETLVLAKRYTDQTVAGGGAIKGKNCIVEGITSITGGNRVTFKSTLDDGTVQRDTMDVMNGTQGIQGVKGDTGNTGADGPKGDTGTITVGTVSSGDSPAVVNVGTSTDAVFNFTLPKGDKGDKGDKGEDGQNGSSFSIRARFQSESELIAAYPDGPENPGDAYFVGTTANPDLYIWLIDEEEWHNNGPIAGVKGDKGDTGNDGFSPVASVSKAGGVATISIRDKTGQTTATVSDGTNGTNGKSAYQVAVDEGFVGTEAEWLASLVGEKGEDGANGTNGHDGVSPIANVTKSGNVFTIHIQDAIGTTEETIDMSSYATASDLSTVQGKIPSTASSSNKLATASDVSAVANDVSAIEDVVPSGASSSNKLATASDISGITEKIPSGASSSNKLATASDITGITEKIPSNASSSNKLIAKSDTVTKHNYSMVGTASLEDDIKTFVTALIALGANTYVGFFNRSGNLGTAGNYSITIYAEEGTSTFASGYIALGAGAMGKTQYVVSYYKPTGSSEEWTIQKLVTDAFEALPNNDCNNAHVAGFHLYRWGDAAAINSPNNLSNGTMLTFVYPTDSGSWVKAWQQCYTSGNKMFLRDGASSDNGATFTWNAWKNVSGDAMNLVTGSADSLTTPGFYTGDSLTNAPSIGWYSYIVTALNNDPNFVTQFAVQDSNMYTRSLVAGGTWTAWKQIAVNTVQSGTYTIPAQTLHNLESAEVTIPLMVNDFYCGRVDFANLPSANMNLSYNDFSGAFQDARETVSRSQFVLYPIGKAYSGTLHLYLTNYTGADVVIGDVQVAYYLEHHSS